MTPTFPAELAGRRQWLIWRYIDKPGQKKPAKMPYYADGTLRSGQQGSEADRARLVSLEEAWHALGRLGADGLGFAFLPGDGLVGIDLDAVDLPEREALTDRILCACATYAEWSPSERGIHLIGLATAETIKSNDIGVELFCGRQFFTMTGARLDHPSCRPEVMPLADGAIQLITEAIAAARAARQPAPVAAAPETPSRTRQDAPRARVGGSVDRYVTKAFETAVARVQAAAEGGRNDCLNQEAYGLGRLMHTGLLAEHRIVTALSEAAVACGLPPGEAAATIRSGIRSGQQNPRVIEERFDRRLPDPSSTVDPETGEIIPAPPPPANDNHDMRSVQWDSPFPDTDNKGKPLGTIINVAEACRRLRVTIRYNVIRKDREIIIPGQGFSIDNEANASLAWLLSALEKFRIPTGKADDYVTYLADQNPFNPVTNWIGSKAWDGRSRLDGFFGTIELDGEDEPDMRSLKQACMRRWMISAIAAVFSPTGVSAHGVLTLQGNQYLGKTKWFKSLAPASHKLIADGVLLKPDDKDSVEQTISYWIVELGELDATFKKSDISQLKAFLTKDSDILRSAYARRKSRFARRTVFGASVNQRQFLHDATGNRRYWTLPCLKIHHDHDFDMQQVWAEVHDLYARGETWYLTKDEMDLLNAANRDHEVADPIRERLQSRLDWTTPESMWRWLTATDVCQEVGFDRPTRADATSCGHYAIEMNGGQRRRSNGKNLLLVPPKVF